MGSARLMEEVIPSPPRRLVSEVDSCERVETDGGVDAGANGGDPQVTLHVHYLVYEFYGV